MTNHEYNQEPTPPDVGNLRDWAGLFQTIYDTSQQAASRMQEVHDQVRKLGSTWMPGVETANLELHFVQGSDDPNEVTEAAQRASELYKSAGEKMIDSLESYRNAAAKIGEIMKGYNPTTSAWRVKHEELAESLACQPPASYTTRAIGKPHPAISDGWHFVRGQVEVGRQLLGITDPEATLPIPPERSLEPWHTPMTISIIAGIQRVQVAQMMLDPATAAEQSHAFGKPQIIEELGLPPVSNAEVVALALRSDFKGAVWGAAALSLTVELEPSAQGLLIDRPV